MEQKPRFKITDHVRLTPDGKKLLKFFSRGGQPTMGAFQVLGREDRTARDEGYHYLLENIENPDHFALWVPDLWLKRSEVTIPEGGRR